MIQLQLGQAKPEVARRCGDAGLAVTDAGVIARLNSGIQELISEGEWPNLVEIWRIVSVSGELALPDHLDRLMQLNLRGVPQTIMSPWAQFVAYGTGTVEDRAGFNRWWCDQSNILDRGEKPTRVTLPLVDGPWFLRVYTAVDEAVATVNPFCTIQGTNEDDEIIRTLDTTWYNGERVELDFSAPYIQTTAEFKTITAFTKPETNGYIKLTAWNSTDEIELSNYAPSDTAPSYHHYFSQWLNDLTAPTDSPLRVVQARCRKRFVPASEDTDLLLISNLPALCEIVIAQYKRDADDMDSFAQHKAVAVELMRAEAAVYRGKSRLPGLTFQRGYAIGSDLPALR